MRRCSGELKRRHPLAHQKSELIFDLIYGKLQGKGLYLITTCFTVAVPLKQILLIMKPTILNW